MSKSTRAAPRAALPELPDEVVTGITHGELRKLHTQIEQLKTEVEQLRRELREFQGTSIGEGPSR